MGQPAFSTRAPEAQGWPFHSDSVPNEKSEVEWFITWKTRENQVLNL